MAEDVGMTKSLSWPMQEAAAVRDKEHAPLQDAWAQDLRCLAIPGEQAQKWLVVHH